MKRTVNDDLREMSESTWRSRLRLFLPSRGDPDDHDLLEAAEERHAARTLRRAWRESPERSKYRRRVRATTILLVLGAGMAALIAAGVEYNSDLQLRQPPEPLDYLAAAGAGALLGLVTLGMLAVLFLFLYRRAIAQEFDDRILLTTAREELQEAEQEAAAEAIDGQADFVALWSVTQKRLDYYHKIATTQAEKSFLYARGAAVAGFGVLVLSAAVAGFAPTTSASVAAGAVGVAASALGGYIGKTFMKSQQTASAQLRAYFLQPLEVSKYLTAERLLNSLEGHERAAATAMLISAIANRVPVQTYHRRPKSLNLNTGNKTRTFGRPFHVRAYIPSRMLVFRFVLLESRDVGSASRCSPASVRGTGNPRLPCGSDGRGRPLTAVT